MGRTFVTLMNYRQDDVDNINMCLGWIYLINKFHKDARIIIYYVDNLSPLFKQFGNVEFIKIDYDKYDHLSEDFLTSKLAAKVLMHDYFKDIKEPFMFIDADAWVLTDVSDVFDRCEKPVTFTTHVKHENQTSEFVNYFNNPNHKMYGKKPFLAIEDLLNSGVFVQNESIITSDDLLTILEDEDYCYVGADQSLVHQLFQKTGYEPFDFDNLPQSYNVGYILNVDRNNPYKITSPVYDGDVKIAHGYGGYDKFYKSYRTELLWKTVMNEMKSNGVKIL